ncbi:MAG TPA: anthranilate phosphoribosyltransferase, partial [Acidimicrobiia bacterium]|nr:anthranilate phosphoribosyltransferase [Acidimicrobiia bacterium]
MTQKQDLTAEELTEFVEAMRDETVTDVQIAGFLVALLMKGPTVDEVAAIARAMRANCVQIRPDVDGNLTDMCGTGGGLTTFNVSSANAILTAAAGVPVAKHGSRSISASSGSADALEALGVSVELTPDQGRQLIEQVGISFLYAPNFHPIMLKVFFPELALGIKTIFFTIIGPLINPAGAPHHMMGVYKPDLVGMVGDVVAQLDMRHVIVAHGSGGPGDTAGAGLDEISILGPTKIAEVTGDSVQHYTITPEDFGLKTATFDDI